MEFFVPSMNDDNYFIAILYDLSNDETNMQSLVLSVFDIRY